MKKIVLLTFVLVLLSTAVVVGFVRPAVAEETIYIRADGSIEGTTHISTFDNATYTFTDNIFNQSIVVEKDNIVVDGAGYTLKGTGTEYSKGITLFERTNVTINNIKIETFYFGIYLDGSSFNTIYGNNITNNRYGIYLIRSNRINVSGNTITSDINVYGVESISLYYSNENIFGENLITNNQSVGSIGIRFGHHDDNNILIQNIITNNEWGIYVELYNENNTIVDNTISNNSWTGIYLRDSDKNSVVDNTVSHNQEYGIYVYRCCDSIILSNILSRNKFGIYLDDNAKRNNISCNTISSNACGVCLWKLNATDNRIYHNNFMSNTAASSLLSNAWDDGYPSGGNYWSDYTGVDANMDGIGDNSYEIDSMNIDHYPLMGMFSEFPVILEEGKYHVTTVCNSTISAFEFDQMNRIIRFNVTGEEGVGFCRVCISHDLMEPPYIVTVDGYSPLYVNYTLYDNGTYRWIYFTYQHSTQEVIIIPEFPTWASMLLMLIVLTVAIATYKRRLLKTPIH